MLFIPLQAKPDAAFCSAKFKEVLDVNLGGAKSKEVVDVNLGGAKRKLVTSFAVDDNDSGSSSQKKSKKEWSCAVCHIVATSEKGLNDHLQGKKHKVKAASLTTPKMGKSTKTTLSLKKSNKCVKSTQVVVTMNSGLDGRQDGSDISSADKGKLELVEKDLAVQKTQNLGGIDTEKNEATTEKEVSKTNALTRRKRFKFYCEFCQVRTHSEIVMQSHKSGKKHLANIAKINPNNSAGACAAANAE